MKLTFVSNAVRNALRGAMIQMRIDEEERERVAKALERATHFNRGYDDATERLSNSSGPDFVRRTLIRAGSSPSYERGVNIACESWLRRQREGLRNHG